MHKYTTSPPLKTPTLAVVLALTLLSGTAGTFARSLQVSAPATDEMTGMVQTVDTLAREVRVITGVGHSLRLIVFHAGDGCRIAVAGKEADLRDVPRGAVVSVRYRRIASLYEADAIDATPKQNGVAR